MITEYIIIGCGLVSIICLLYSLYDVYMINIELNDNKKDI